VLSLAADPICVDAARRFVRGECVGSAAALADDAVLLTSELVTNAIRYAPKGPIFVRVTRPSADRIRVAVADGGGEAVPCVCGGPDQEASSGRGFMIVRALAAEWGLRVEPAACEVWFVVELTEKPDRHCVGIPGDAGADR